MSELTLSSAVIDKVQREVYTAVMALFKEDLVKVILYGSCARGDFTDDSDIDIALLTRCDRLEAKKYGDALAMISTDLAMKYFAVVNFVCIPYKEFSEKREWYAYFHNIEMEGKILYG